jgi:ribonuclease HII
MTSLRSQSKLLNIESKLRDSGIIRIAGVDEAGRGPCAGPLVVAAVILKDSNSQALARVRDSKELSEKVREELFPVVKEESLAFSIIEIWPTELDELGLHKSNLEGMRRAVSTLTVVPEYVLTDGYAIEGMEMPTLAVWKGDQVALSISAASILAKVHRDHIMIELDAKHPGYGFAAHKGYITAAHTAALEKLGVSQVHRKSFANIHKLINSQS